MPTVAGLGRVPQHLTFTDAQDKAPPLQQQHKVSPLALFSDLSFGTAQPPTDFRPPLPRERWTPRQVAIHCRTGESPKGEPTSLHTKQSVIADTARMCHPESSHELDRFVQAVSATRDEESLTRLAEEHIVQPEGGPWRFRPMSPTPPLGPNLVGKPNYESFLAVSRMDVLAFKRLCQELSRRIPFLAKVFDEPRHAAWGLDFFQAVGKQLLACTSPGEAAAVVMFHPDCYGLRRGADGREKLGSGVTHISVMAITPQGEVCLNHQESITIAPDKKPVRNLMVNALGLVSDSFDTRALHERAAQTYGQTPPAELPVDQSFRLHGGPICMVNQLKDFEGFRRLTKDLEARATGAEGMHMLYAGDADHVMRETIARFEAGEVQEHELKALLGERFLFQPDVAPPGAAYRKSPIDYSNNCTLTTLLALMAGRCDAVKQWRDEISPSTPAWRLHQIMFLAGIMPDTDPELWKRSRDAWANEQDINAKSVAILGFNQAVQAGMGYAPDVRRGLRKERSQL